VIRFRLAADYRISFGELDSQRSARCLEIQRAFAAAAVPSAVSDWIVPEMWGKFYAAVAALATLTRAGLARSPRCRPAPPSRRLQWRNAPGHRRRGLSAAAGNQGFRAWTLLPARLRLPAIDRCGYAGVSADRGRAYDRRSGPPRRSPAGSIPRSCGRCCAICRSTKPAVTRGSDCASRQAAGDRRTCLRYLHAHSRALLEPHWNRALHAFPARMAYGRGACCRGDR
jgi:hypothetical protein